MLNDVVNWPWRCPMHSIRHSSSAMRPRSFLVPARLSTGEDHDYRDLLCLIRLINLPALAFQRSHLANAPQILPSSRACRRHTVVMTSLSAVPFPFRLNKRIVILENQFYGSTILPAKYSYSWLSTPLRLVMVSAVLIYSSLSRRVTLLSRLFLVSSPRRLTILTLKTAPLVAAEH